MNSTDSITVRDVLRIFFSHKIFFIVLPPILLISAYIGLEMKTPMYEATVTMFIKAQKTTEAEFYQQIAARNPVYDHSELVKSNTVLNRVVMALKLYEQPIDNEKQYASNIKKAVIKYRLKKVQRPTDTNYRISAALGKLQGSITVRPISESNHFRITVRDFNPNNARKIVNSISRSYVMFDLEQQIEELKLKYGEKHSVVLQLEEYIENFRETLHGNIIPDLQAMGPASVKIVSQAEGAYIKQGLSKNVILIFSFVTGILLSISLAVMIEFADSTFKTTKQVVDHLKLPVLGSIPKRKAKEAPLIFGKNSKMTLYVQSTYLLSEHLSILINDKKISTLLLTDVEGSKETSFITTNVGLYLSRLYNHKVVIIDADLRHSSLTSALNISNALGLADALEKKSSVMDIIQDMGSNLNVLPSGNTQLNPLTLLGSSGMIEIINELQVAYDLVLINCPDSKNYTEAVVLSSITDGTALVMNEGKVRVKVLDNVMEIFRKKHINIIGVIMNNRIFNIPNIIYKLT